jgi:predicted lipoprotein with Yx(FWY)xxD motif
VAGGAPLGALSILLAACGGGGSKTSTASQPAAAATPTSLARPAAASSPSVVAITNPKLGKILANAKDMVLYIYTADKGGKSACSGVCLKYWPALLLPSGVTHPTAGPGVSGLGTVAEPEGTQVTYHGMPLYTYIGDKGPNQTTGQGVVDSGGTWYVVSLSAAAKAPPATTAATTAPPVTAAPASSPPVTAPVATAPPTMAPTPQKPMTIPATTAAPPKTSPPATSPPTTAPRRTTPTTVTPTTVPGGGGVSY